jgi:AcrR family transcriptional regulator
LDRQVQSEEAVVTTTLTSQTSPPTLTAKGRATRARIIEGAAAVIRAEGAAGTTLDDIRGRTGTSKSQLFHYFPAGKEQLLLAVAQHEADRVLSDQEPFLSHLGSWAQWSAWRDAVVDRYRRQGQNCPLSAVTSQLGPASPGAQAVTTQLFHQWERAIADGISEMQRRRLVRASLDARQAAAALLAGLQGGVMILLATGQLTHLEAALDVGIANLRGQTG